MLKIMYILLLFYTLLSYISMEISLWLLMTNLTLKIVNNFNCTTCSLHLTSIGYFYLSVQTFYPSLT
jgi:hypothetical protein